MFTYTLGIDIRKRHWFTVPDVGSFSEAQTCLLDDLSSEKPIPILNNVTLDDAENEFEGTKYKNSIAIVEITCQACGTSVGDDPRATRAHRCAETADATT